MAKTVVGLFDTRNEAERVAEEVNANKNAGQHPETVRDFVRHADIDVQDLDAEVLAENPALRSHRANRGRP